MNNLTEAEIRKIVREEMERNYNSGSPRVSPHSHNGTDGLKVNIINLEGVSVVPSETSKYLNEYTAAYEYGFPGEIHPSLQEFINQKEVTVLPRVPVITGGVPAGGFNGGWAPDGTMLMYDTGGLTSILYVRSQGRWVGAVLNQLA
jgi:hypothetical protein